MGNTLSITPQAESDLMESFKWYEARRDGLGHEFLRCVDARLNLIARAPELFRPRGALLGQNGSFSLRDLFYLAG